MSKHEKTAADDVSIGGGKEIAELGSAGDSHTKHDTTSAALMQAGIERLLLHGEANALTAAELAQITRQTPREVTRSIQRARLAGKPICASGEGFFLADDATELARYVRSLDRRIGEIRRTREALGDVLAAATGQTHMEG